MTINMPLLFNANKFYAMLHYITLCNIMLRCVNYVMFFCIIRNFYYILQL